MRSGLRRIGLVAVLLFAEFERRRLFHLVGIETRRGGQHRAQGVVEIAGALAVLGREGDRLAEAERIGVVHALARRMALGLVREQDDRLVRAADRLREMAVARRNARRARR